MVTPVSDEWNVWAKYWHCTKETKIVYCHSTCMVYRRLSITSLLPVAIAPSPAPRATASGFKTKAGPLRQTTGVL